MKVVKFQVGPMRANAYLVFKEGASSAILIDAGGNYPRILDVARENGVKIDYVLLTHGHFDHVGAVSNLQKDGAKVYMHTNDVDKVTTDKSLCGISHIKIEKFTPDELVWDGDKLHIADLVVEVIHTPGHTSGGVCYLIGGNLFCGDTLFHGSFGRVDLGDGNMRALKDSIIEKIFSLPDDVTVHPGHEDSTTVGREKQYNPIYYYA